MAGTAFTVRVRVEGGRELLAAFRRLPKAANDALRDGTMALATLLAARAASAGRAEGRQAALMAPTVKPLRDRVPALQAGGSARVGRKHAPAYGLLFASEFGASRRSGWYAMTRYEASAGRQYRPHAGRGSYWFFRTIEQNQAAVSSAWSRVATRIIDDFTGSP